MKKWMALVLALGAAQCTQQAQEQPAANQEATKAEAPAAVEIKWHHGTLDSAFTLAKAENKQVMVDFYTEW